MKKLSLLMILCCITFASFAQHPGRGGKKGGKKDMGIKGKITGTILDQKDEKPIEFASVLLVQVKKSKEGEEQRAKEIDGVITNEKGDFKLENVPMGKYRLRITFLGYEDKIIEDVMLTRGKPDVKLKDIFLSSGLTLNEVLVTGEAGLIENKIDKMVYNAEKDVSTVGGDAADVLRKVPLLSVDFDGNVSLRGSSNIRVLINGKPSNFFSENLADALKTIPADQIKKVEVITQPTAKYDGEGTAGIINIITKKKNLEGFTGTVSASVGTRSNRGSLNLAAAKGRFGMNANLGAWLSWPREAITTLYREDFDGEEKIIYDESGTAESTFYGPHGSLGAYYDINGFNSLSTSLSYRVHGGGRDGVVNVLSDDPISDIHQAYSREYVTKTFSGGFDWTTDYRKTFENPDQELTFAVQLSGSKRDQNKDVDQKDDTGLDNSLLVKEVADNNSNNLETTLQLDYVQPFGELFKWEVGAKTVFRNITSTFSTDVFDFDTETYLNSEARSDVFNYKQNVYAAYSSFNFKFGEKYGLIAGVRYERTGISGDLTSGNTDGFSENYDNILPSIIISRNFKNFRMLKLSYAQRIQRPRLSHINPFIDQSNRRNISYGNPQLRPENAKQVELSYNTMIKGVMLNAAIYYKNTTDVIESFIEIEEVNGENIATQTFKNIGIDNAIGFNLFSSATIAKILSIRGNFNMSTYNVTSTIEGLDLTTQSYRWNGRISGTLSLKKGWKAEAFGFFRPKRRTIQGFSSSFSMFSMGIKKDLWKKRGSIGIRIVEPFSKYKTFPSELTGENFYQKSNYEIPFRSFGISFSYRFGKLDFKQKSRRTKIKNDDLKEEASGNN